METLQMLQQLAPAAIVAVLVLPWTAVMAMHAVSAATRPALDGKWRAA